MRKKLLIEFKYEGGPWELYDTTMVNAWAEIQEQRVKREHPEAEHRVRVEGKKK